MANALKPEAIVRGIPARARVILRILIEHADEAGRSYLSRRELAERAGMAVGEKAEPSHLSRILRQMEQARVIRTEGRSPDHGYANVIRVDKSLGLALQGAVLYRGMSPQDAWIYEGITNRVYPESQSDWPTTKDLAAELGVSTWGLGKAIERLVEAGYVTVERGMPGTAAYRQTAVLPERIG